MSKAAKSPELKQAFDTHLEETKGQIERLDEIFETLGKKATGKTCHGMQGLVEEGQEMIQELDKGAVRDAALIAAAQRVEIQPARGGNHNLAIKHTPLRQLCPERCDEFRKVTVKRFRVAALQEHFIAIAKDQGAESIPLRLKNPAGAGGNLLNSLGEHRQHRRCDGQVHSRSLRRSLHRLVVHLR